MNNVILRIIGDLLFLVTQVEVCDMCCLVAITVRSDCVATWAQETITSIGIARVKTDMQRANLGWEWIIEEVKKVALATPVDWSLFVVIEHVVLLIGFENDFMTNVGDSSRARCDIPFEAKDIELPILLLARLVGLIVHETAFVAMRTLFVFVELANWYMVVFALITIFAFAIEVTITNFGILLARWGFAFCSFDGLKVENLFPLGRWLVWLLRTCRGRTFVSPTAVHLCQDRAR